MGLVSPCYAPSNANWTFAVPAGDLLGVLALTEDEQLLVAAYVKLQVGSFAFVFMFVCLC